jgi:KipI family sensor histidine kinase inhibitor
VRIDLFGEGALLAVLGQGMRPSLNDRVHALADAVRADALAGFPWRTPVPSFDSLLVPFDPLAVDAETSSGRLRGLAEGIDAAARPGSSDSPVVEIPVRFGGMDGPDLVDVASRLGLEPSAVVRLYTRRTYRVYMLGFTPGWAYLGVLPERLRLPRRATPRLQVPAGSVGIAGRQTGVYATPSPGGFHLIGRTDTVLWDPDRVPPNLLGAGRSVRFVAIA